MSHAWYHISYGNLAQKSKTAQVIAGRDQAVKKAAAGDTAAIGTPEKPYLTDAEIAQKVSVNQSVPNYNDQCGAFDIACKVGKFTDAVGAGIAKGVFIFGVLGIVYLVIKLR